jgi:hypothetical protein
MRMRPQLSRRWDNLSNSSYCASCRRFTPSLAILSSSDKTRCFLRCFFGFWKRWMADRAKSGLYGGWSTTVKQILGVNSCCSRAHGEENRLSGRTLWIRVFNSSQPSSVALRVSVDVSRHEFRMTYTLNVHLVSVTVSSVTTINIFHSPMNLNLWDVFCGQNSIAAGTLFRTDIVCSRLRHIHGCNSEALRAGRTM